LRRPDAILDQSAAAIAPGRPWQAVIDQLPRPPMPSGGIGDLYRKTLSDLARHCSVLGLMTADMATNCPVSVERIPDYMRPVRSNAAYSMPPVHPPRGGTFFILETGRTAPIPADYQLLTAHETFPGHHLLDTCRWGHERPVRRHIEFPIFYEGWASFAEELMFETGFSPVRWTGMLMAKRRFWRALRGQVDFDIHMHRRTLDEAAAFLSSQGMAPGRAMAMVRRYSLKPGYQLAYTIGRRRFWRLYDNFNPQEKIRWHSPAGCWRRGKSALIIWNRCCGKEVNRVQFSRLSFGMESRQSRRLGLSAHDPGNRQGGVASDQHGEAHRCRPGLRPPDALSRRGLHRDAAGGPPPQEGTNPGLLAVVAEEETLADVTENINLARRLDAVDGITGILAAPHEFELKNGRVSHQGRPVSLIFMDFNNDVFLNLHRKHDLTPLYQAIRENRILNPRGTEPINVKSMFEVITGPQSDRFDPETVGRTPWTRRFFPAGPPAPTEKPSRTWSNGPG
jgi:hypothetical protein